MLIETYEVEEAGSEAATMAADSEATELIQKLGLSGQSKLLNPETHTRFPYRKMTAAEARVFKIICPKETGLNDYSDGLIPIRVLQVAAHVTELGFCDRIQVWHPENADIKDPFLVGLKGPEYGDRERFLLARWGEELPSFEELSEKALKIWRMMRKSAFQKILATVQSELAGVDSDVGLGDMPVFYPR